MNENYYPNDQKLDLLGQIIICKLLGIYWPRYIFKASEKKNTCRFYQLQYLLVVRDRSGSDAMHVASVIGIFNMLLMVQNQL